MTIFENELKKGNFVISECNSCKRVVWPPSDYCNNCLSNVTWRKVNPAGRLIEFSKKNEIIFGLVELEEKIRIIGKLKSNLADIREGQCVRLHSCDYDSGPQFTFVSCNGSY
ncbi:MAG: Zn-ribbon domain-containing OB-fold protein [Nitrososphaerota archaeon]